MWTYRVIVIALFALLRMGDAYAEAEPKEITIHIRGEYNKAVISALLAAADAKTPRTGIAELDSLAATYGLMGIYHKSGFYGYQFRLTFPPGADGAAIAGAYRNVSYIQAVVGEAEELPVLLGHRTANGLRGIHVLDGGEHAVVRIPTKVICGTLSGIAFTAIGVVSIEDRGDAGSPILFGMLIGSIVGFPLGVSFVDPYDSLPVILLAGVIPGAAGILWASNSNSSGGLELALVGPIIGSLYASEKWRQPPQARRVSFALSPTLNGGLSAVAQLRF